MNTNTRLGPLLIVSFHRSGSSLTAQLFHAAGLHLGDKLLGAKPSNPYGHFEDTEIIQFHDRLLQKDEHGWYHTRGPVATFNDVDQAWIRSYVARKKIKGRAFGVKDPRLCLTIRHWQAALGRIKVVFVYRNAYECCTSMWSRAVEDYRRGAAVELNAALASNPDQVARIYAHNLSSFLSWRRSYPHTGTDMIAIAYEDMVSGARDIVAECRDKWGYPLRDVSIEDYYDRSAVTATQQHAVGFRSPDINPFLDTTNQLLEGLCRS